jgi:predicted GIY-YIG superfamily endonuclease
VTESNRRPWDHDQCYSLKAAWTRDHRGESFVYFVKDATTGELLYIGSTGHLIHRVATHHCRGSYLRQDVRYEIEGPFRTRAAAYAREAECIATERPRDNERQVDRRGAA